MHITPYLNFNGTCREAFAFYADLLGGEVEFMQSFGDTPEMGETPPEWKDAVMHASLRYPGGTLLASDAPGDMYKPAQGLWVSLHVDDIAEAERLWGRLSDGGTVTMPLEQTFWAKRFGMVTDRFGTPWMLNCA
jgi:PhnB protein